MASLARQRCLNHEAREAVCRCPSCRNFFCRECAVLFESRLLCATCLAAQAKEDTAFANRPTGVAIVAWAMLACLFAWLFFYFAGWTILQFRERAVVASIGAGDSQVQL